MIVSRKQGFFPGCLLVAWLLLPVLTVCAGTVEYSYDMLNRVVRADYDGNGTAITYSYDTIGNREQEVSGGSIPPDVALLISPSWCSDSTTPVFTWEEGPGSVQHKLRVQAPDGTMVISQWFTDAEVNCDGTVCSIPSPQALVNGETYTWNVLTWNGTGYGPLSESLDFTVSEGACPAPAATTLTSPTWCSDNPIPVFRWEQVSGAVQYKLRGQASDGTVILSQWYSDMEAACDGTSCVVTAPQALADGRYTWHVLTWNASGEGPWSETASFTVNTGYCPAEPTAVPGQPTLQTPDWCTDTLTPTLVWDETPNAAEYKVNVQTADGTVTLLNAWYTWTEAACNGTTCSVSAPALANKTIYRWQVLPWNGFGYGPWSEDQTFTTNEDYCLPQPTVAPGQPTLLTPSSCSDTLTPTLTWNETANASWYKVRVRLTDGTTVLSQWYQWWETNCNGTTCEIPAPVLADTTSYVWDVLPWSSYGYGPVSDELHFVVHVGYCVPPPTDVPGPITPLAPSGCLTDMTPELRWTESANAFEYKVFVDTSDGTIIVPQWYTWWQADCDGTECGVTLSALSEGTYTWQVLPWGAYGYGPMSASLSFEVAAGCPPEMMGGDGLADVIFRKSGNGSGTIQVGTQECGEGCEALQVPYADYALLTVIPADGSHFVRLEREDGSPLNIDSFEVSPGETVFVIFEHNE